MMYKKVTAFIVGFGTIGGPLSATLHSLKKQLGIILDAVSNIIEVLKEINKFVFLAIVTDFVTMFDFCKDPSKLQKVPVVSNKDNVGNTKSDDCKKNVLCVPL